MNVLWNSILEVATLENAERIAVLLVMIALIIAVGTAIDNSRAKRRQRR